MVGVRCGFINGCNGRSVCDVQCGGDIAAAHVSGYMEQCLVSAFGICGDQLYEELDVCLFCGCGIVDWSLCFDDSAAQGERAEGAGDNLRYSYYCNLELSSCVARLDEEIASLLACGLAI